MKIKTYLKPRLRRFLVHFGEVDRPILTSDTVDILRAFFSSLSFWNFQAFYLFLLSEVARNPKLPELYHPPPHFLQEKYPPTLWWAFFAKKQKTHCFCQRGKTLRPFWDPRTPCSTCRCREATNRRSCVEKCIKLTNRNKVHETNQPAIHLRGHHADPDSRWILKQAKKHVTKSIFVARFQLEFLQQKMSFGMNFLHHQWQMC